MENDSNIVNSDKLKRELGIAFALMLTTSASAVVSTAAAVDVAFASTDAVAVASQAVEQDADAVKGPEAGGEAVGGVVTAGVRNEEQALEAPQVEKAVPDENMAAPAVELVKVKYTVRHFTVSADGTVELDESEQLEGLEGDAVSIAPKTIAGYSFDSGFADGQGHVAKTAGMLASGEELVLDAYYVADDRSTVSVDEQADDAIESNTVATVGEGANNSADEGPAAPAMLRAASKQASDIPMLSVQNASSSVVATGSWGTCEWDIDDSGTLTVHAGIGGKADDFVSSFGDDAKNVTKVVFEDGVVAPEDCTSLFFGLSNAREIDMAGLDTSKTKTMSVMFRGCDSLRSLDMSSLDFSNVEDMRALFYMCSSLESVDMSHIKFAKATNMSSLFYGCESLKDLKMAGLELPNAEDLRAFFYGCSSLETVDISSLVTSTAKNMSAMFYGCSSLKSVDMSNMVASAVEDMSGMFFGCSTLETVDMSNLKAPMLQDMRSFFYGCSSLTKAVLSGLDIPSVTNMSAMFSGCSSLESADLSDINAPKVADLGALFYNCTSLKSVNLSGFGTPALTNIGAMFSGCEALPSVDVSSLDTSNVTTMLAMFDRCKSLTSLDLSTFDTSSATDMGGMFNDCSSLTSLDLTSFNTPNVYSMVAMFQGCTSLRALDISSFDTSSVPTAGTAFDDVASMLSLDFSSLGKKDIALGLASAGVPEQVISLPIFDPSVIGKVGGTTGMFYKCTALDYIVLGSKTKPLGMLPAYSINGHTDWYSLKDGKWYTNMEIDQSRLGIPDTYTKYGPSPITVNSPRLFSFTGQHGVMPRMGDGIGHALSVWLVALMSSVPALLGAWIGLRRERKDQGR